MPKSPNLKQPRFQTDPLPNSEGYKGKEVLLFYVHAATGDMMSLNIAFAHQRSEGTCSAIASGPPT